MTMHDTRRRSIAAMLLGAAGLVATPASGQAITLPSAEELALPGAECGSITPASEPAEDVFVMPTTGMAFTLPGSEPEAVEQLHHCAPVLPPAPVRPPNPSLFSMIAMPIGYGSAPMRKWDSVRTVDLSARAGPWSELLGQAGGTADKDPVTMVNSWVNWRVRYQDDRGGDDWASAPATLIRGYGDCEDFALAKMALLKALGVPSDDMFLILLRDSQRTEHAVLAVKRGGRLVILDNRTDLVLPAFKVKDYTPIMSYSGPFAWVYGEVAR